MLSAIGSGTLSARDVCHLDRSSSVLDDDTMVSSQHPDITATPLVRLARTIVRRRRLILVAAVVAFALSGMLGGDVASKLSSGGFEDPGAESTKAQQYLDAHFK